jgi:hypothetical protein
MRAVEQWDQLERGLSDGWIEVRVSFTSEDPAEATAAAGVLAPLGPGRFGSELRFHVRPSGSNGVATARNLLSRLDRNRIWGALSLVDVQIPDRPLVPVPEGRRLVEAWEDALRTVPPDWTDLLCELEVDSTDYLQRAALLGAPLNPTRNPQRIALRFRVSKRGYGAAPSMTRRCFERMDEETITGRISILIALSETGYAATQGPVWRIAGRAV